MDSDLVGSSGDGVESDAGEAVLDRDFLPMGGAHFTVDLIVDLMGAIFDIEAEGERNGAFIAIKDTLEKGDVMLLRLAFLKLPGEITMSLLGQGEHEEAGGVHVKAMDRGLRNAACDGGANTV